MPRKKILILGATGFIGRNSAEYFAEQADYEVYGTCFKSPPLNHPDIQMQQADLTKQGDVDRVVNGMDVVIQAAAVTSGIKDVADNPHAFISDNAVMNSLVFRSAFDHSVSSTILLSCTVMYQSSGTPLKENDFDANGEIYPSYFGGAWNKVYFEKMCEFYSRLGRGKFTAIRHSNVYGPFDKYDLQKAHVFGATVAKVMEAEDGRLTVWGAGEEKRDLLHVSDLVRGFHLAIEKQTTPYELYNMGLGQAISIKDLVEKIIGASGKTILLEHDLTKPSNKTSLCLDCEKAKSELGWEPNVSLEEGIQKTLSWYKEKMTK
jgi:nucleoside-diphosphate-sugar epimerase